MEYVPAIGVGVTVMVAAGAFALYVIRGEIARGPKNAQPRNGGTGWIDVHSKLDTVLTRQTEVIDDLSYLRGRLDHHIDNHERGQ